MYGWGILVLLSGLLFNYFNIGSPNFQIFGGIGNWLIYIGFIGLIIASFKTLIKKKPKVVDERMAFIASKASRVAFTALFITAFAVIIIDGIKTIMIPYHLFVSYLICFILIVYFVSYRILLKFY